MKAVYIVTDGTYSDYTIERVFSNPEAAEEYKRWKRITNEVEEFIIHDEPFTEEDGRRAMLIRVQGTVYPEAVVDIKYVVRPNMIYEGYITRGAGVMGYQRNNGIFTIYNYHYISADKWDEEKYKAKLTKTLYDLAAVAKSMFAEGATVDMVNEALMNKFEEDQP